GSAGRRATTCSSCARTPRAIAREWLQRTAARAARAARSRHGVSEPLVSAGSSLLKSSVFGAGVAGFAAGLGAGFAGVFLGSGSVVPALFSAASCVAAIVCCTFGGRTAGKRDSAALRRVAYHV